MLSAGDRGPSSRPGSTWQCRSIIRALRQASGRVQSAGVQAHRRGTIYPPERSERVRPQDDAVLHTKLAAPRPMARLCNASPSS
jgi:hypothetical protein